MTTGPSGPRLQRGGREGGRSRWAGLDGLRALAVAAVVLFHLGMSWMPGGFLGVDVFFVISGYLITRLLLEEHHRFGRIDLRRFYLRRARRLLPALGVLLLACGVGVAFVWRDAVASFRGDALAAAGYATNWWYVFRHQSYFQSTGRPDVLQHLWSLAVEEQFYLLWPALLLIVVAVVTRSRRTAMTPTRAVAAIAGVGAVASTMAMAAIAIATDVPYGADSSRVYFGTDTHAMGLLTGAALAALTSDVARAGGMRAWLAGRRVLARLANPRWFDRWRPTVLARDAIGVAALATVGWACLHTGEFSVGLYRGGFLAVSLTTAVLIAVVVADGSRLGAALDCAPLRWLGHRSYAIYLWHWPIVVVTRPQLDLAWPGWSIQVFRVALTLVLADLSFRLVEQPVRDGRFGRAVRSLLAGWWELPMRRLAGATVAAATPAFALVVALAIGLSGQAPVRGQAVAAPVRDGAPVAHGIGAIAPGSDPAGVSSPVGPSHDQSPADHAEARASGDRSGPAGLGAATSTGRDPGATRPAPLTPSAQQPAPPQSQPPGTPPSSPGSGPQPVIKGNAPTGPRGAVSAFGDSVMVGAETQLRVDLPGVVVDAREGRQFRQVDADIMAAKKQGSLAPIVIIHTGNNGIIAASELDGLLSKLADRKRVVVVNDRVPRDWQAPNNSMFASVVARHHNAVLVDWYGASAAHVAAWLWGDGLHLRPQGAAAYARLLAAAA